MTAEQRNRAPAILVVDDDDLLRSNVAEVLTEAGYEVEEARTGLEAATMLESTPRDLVITDIFMPDMDGIELVRALHRSAGDTRLLAMSGHIGEVDYLEIAQVLGACRTLRKPFRSRELVEAVEHCLQSPKSSLAESFPQLDD